MKIHSYKRRKCAIKGCNNHGRNKGFYKGKTRYDKYCEYHHRLRYGTENRAYYHKKVLISNKKCSVCGWDKAFCDRHRIDAKKDYTKENVIVLCPNCHRLADLEKFNSRTQDN